MTSNDELNYCHYSDLPSPMAYLSIEGSKESVLSPNDVDRIIEMAWEDRTSFEAIEFQFGLSEAEVRVLMKRELKFRSYVKWRKRVESCTTKHGQKRPRGMKRFKCTMQRTISNNRISKRRNK